MVVRLSIDVQYFHIIFPPPTRPSNVCAHAQRDVVRESETERGKKTFLFLLSYLAGLFFF
jgi:hypothetical protein